jgi:hypothetical protein
MSTSPYKIFATLDSNGVIYSASGGSVKNHQGSFGWLMSSPGGTVILKCSSPAYGKQMKLYRAKGYGMLSLLCFIYDLFSFCQQSLPAALPLFFNSKNLLDKTRTYLRHPWYYPNTSLQSDWDVVLQITSTILLLPNRPHLVHVKAYQGNAATFDDLPAS